MMDSKSVLNMWSSLPNTFEKECISLAFIIRKLIVLQPVKKLPTVFGSTCPYA